MLTSITILTVAILSCLTEPHSNKIRSKTTRPTALPLATSPSHFFSFTLLASACSTYSTQLHNAARHKYTPHPRDLSHGGIGVHPRVGIRRGAGVSGSNLHENLHTQSKVLMSLEVRCDAQTFPSKSNALARLNRVCHGTPTSRVTYFAARLA
jgi:hypothetical protein